MGKAGRAIGGVVASGAAGFALTGFTYDALGSDIELDRRSEAVEACAEAIAQTPDQFVMEVPAGCERYERYFVIHPDDMLPEAVKQADPPPKYQLWEPESFHEHFTATIESRRELRNLLMPVAGLAPVVIGVWAVGKWLLREHRNERGVHR